MTATRFRELVNAYLDREISLNDLRALRKAVSGNPERQREFEQLVRLRLAEQAIFQGASDDSPRPKRPRRRGRAQVYDSLIELQLAERRKRRILVGQLGIISLGFGVMVVAVIDTIRASNQEAAHLENLPNADNYGSSAPFTSEGEAIYSAPGRDSSPDVGTTPVPELEGPSVEEVLGLEDVSMFRFDYPPRFGHLQEFSSSPWQDEAVSVSFETGAGESRGDP